MHTHMHTHACACTHTHTQEKNHFILVDMAYQGFATGNLDSDAAGLRLLVKEGHKVALSQSFSKNMGLYGELGEAECTGLVYITVDDFSHLVPSPLSLSLLFSHSPSLSPFFSPSSLSSSPGERVGALTFICSNEQEVKAVESQLKILIRPLYSNPPINGARIATEIMTQPEVYNEWYNVYMCM